MTECCFLNNAQNKNMVFVDNLQITRYNLQMLLIINKKEVLSWALLD